MIQLQPLNPFFSYPNRQQVEVIIPARVEKALEFLGLLTFKTMDRAAVSDSQVVEIEGQKLTAEETSAQATALSLLEQYFAGKLQPDVWEDAKVKFEDKSAEAAGKKSKEGKGMGDGSVIQCPAGCLGQCPDCKMCNGTGRVFVTPFRDPATA